MKIDCELKISRIDRNKYFGRGSLVHPAKMDLGLCVELIRKYTKPGDTILDMMSGIGTTGVCILEDRDYIGIEFEEKFCRMQIENLTKIEQYGKKGLFSQNISQWIVIHGDARQLPLRNTDCVITSPPYSNISIPTFYPRRILKLVDEDFELAVTEAMKFEKELSQSYRQKWAARKEEDVRQLLRYQAERLNYSPNKENLGNLPHGDIDMVLSSPPYGEVINRRSGGPVGLENIGISCKSARQYSNSSENIGNLKYEKIDCVLSSPPWGEGIGHGQKKPDEIFLRDGIRNDGPWRCTDNDSNLSHKKGKTYLGEMLKVYREVWRVLKPEGLMILVLKNFVKKGQLVRLDLDTRKLCEAVGFKLLPCEHCNGIWDGGHTHLRRLGNRSFWMNKLIKQYGKGCVYDIRHEVIQVYRKSP